MKKIPYQYPDPSGTERSKTAKELRELATEVARLRPHATTRNNGEENDLAPEFPSNFTKGLPHDNNGIVEDGENYTCFVEAINSKDRTLFEKNIEVDDKFKCKIKKGRKMEKVAWRGWESPRAGHVYELEGPDPAAVGMAPAPKIQSDEFAAEMAEVYSMALLRDIPFTAMSKFGTATPAILTKVITALKSMSFFNPGDSPDRFTSNRKFARTLGAALTKNNIFRGSTKGAQVGPYISQFLLAGSPSLNPPVTTNLSAFPGINSKYGPEDGFVSYGTQVVDQRVVCHKKNLDHLTDWTSWLDVQNGADFRGQDSFEENRRFITTPRDLATYVHYDKLYQAYLNACFMLLQTGVKTSTGFPEDSFSGKRTAFATFGGPHVLSLVTEVATRCLKSVRRQKFNYHRRARPEAIGGRLTLAKAGKSKKLGYSGKFFDDLLSSIPSAIRDEIVRHNSNQNSTNMNRMRSVKCPNPVRPSGVKPDKIKRCNLLLPMAFPEGSPMHPAYGAGHATVAGGCVTMLKAFFEMFDSCEKDGLKTLDLGTGKYYIPNADGSKLLVAQRCPRLTIQGELDKLAANISIGRNFAGVHYYSDYYDSLRMGERIAVGILMEQAPTYGDEMEMSFDSFDGDRVTISGEAGACPSLSIMDKDGNPISPESWWLRHVPGQEIVLDL